MEAVCLLKIDELAIKDIRQVDGVLVREILPMRQLYHTNCEADVYRFSCDIPEFTDLVWDAFQFMRSHRSVIAHKPLQVYHSTLIFTPPSS